MATYDTGAASNMLHGYAFEGVWEKYNEPPFQRWIWTMTASKAIFVLGAYALLLTFTQSRTWVVARHFICSRRKAVRLDGDSQPDPLERISQAGAIRDMFPLILARWRLWRRSIFRGSNVTDSPMETDSSVISPWFGVWALINIGVFSVLGVALPAVLSEGVLGAPIVKSRWTPECRQPQSVRIDDKESEFQLEQKARTDATFDVCLDRLEMACGSQYYLQQPQICKSRTSCPFPRNICHNGTEAFALSHSNITALELGVNSRSTLSMNHRLTCAPVHVDSFIVLDLHYPAQTLVSVQQNQSGEVWDQYVMELETRNGPNIISRELSGHLVSLNLSSTRDFTVLPRESSWSIRHSKSSFIRIHDTLQNDYGASFLAILRPGARKIQSEIDDPFFSARHEYVRNPRIETPIKVYYPDFEATALGCLEQLQFCIFTKGLCTNWGELSIKLLAEAEELLREDLLALTELRFKYRLIFPLPLGVFFVKVASAISVADYLRSRTWRRDNVVPLTKSAPWMNRGETHPRNTKDQWTIEVETWFMKGILNALLFTENGARITLQDEENDYSINYTSKYSICDRILFRDADYTNINLVGISITVCLFSLICIASYAVESLKDGARMVRGTLIQALIYLFKRSDLWRMYLFLKTIGPTRWIAPDRSQLPKVISELHMERLSGPTLGVAGQSEPVETG